MTQQEMIVDLERYGVRIEMVPMAVTPAGVPITFAGKHYVDDLPLCHDHIETAHGRLMRRLKEHPEETI